MISVPNNNVVVAPIEVVIHPSAQSVTVSIGDETSAIRTLEKDDARIINRHVNQVWIGRNNFYGAVIGNNIFLGGGLQVAKVLGLGTQALD